MLKIICGCPLMNMHNIYRYSGVKQVEVESLSNHIVEVQILGSIILNKLNSLYGENLDYGEFLKKALHHDLEESITGDIARPLKYHNEMVHKELEGVADEVSENLYKKYFNGEYYKYWKFAKSDKEGLLVKIVDMLVVAIKAFREVELLNNYYFLKVVYEVTYYLKDTKVYVSNNKYLNNDATIYLLTIIQITLTDLEDLKTKYKDIYDSYKILDTSMIEG